MKYEEAIRKPFTDVGKLALGIMLGLLPIVSWIVRGFALECSGVGKYKTSNSMPEWKDIWHFFVKGLASYVIELIYAIPAIVVFSIAAVYLVGSLASLGIAMPNWSGMSVFPEQFFREIAQNWPQIMPISLVPMIALATVLLVAAMYVYPIGVLNYLKTNDIGKAFDMRVLKATAANRRYFLAWIASGAISIAVSAVASLIPVIGSSVAFFVSGVIAWDLYGQAFRKK